MMEELGESLLAPFLVADVGFSFSKESVALIAIKIVNIQPIPINVNLIYRLKFWKIYMKLELFTVT